MSTDAEARPTDHPAGARIVVDGFLDVTGRSVQVWAVAGGGVELALGDGPTVRLSAGTAARVRDAMAVGFEQAVDDEIDDELPGVLTEDEPVDPR